MFLLFHKINIGGATEQHFFHKFCREKLQSLSWKSETTIIHLRNVKNKAAREPVITAEGGLLGKSQSADARAHSLCFCARRLCGWWKSSSTGEHIVVGFKKLAEPQKQCILSTRTPLLRLRTDHGEKANSFQTEQNRTGVPC